MSLVKHQEVYVGDMYSADHRETILLVLRLIRVATIRGLVAFTTIFCGRINLPEDPSLWSPKATTPGHLGHNPGQIETCLRVTSRGAKGKGTNNNATRTGAILDSVRYTKGQSQGTVHYYPTPPATAYLHGAVSAETVLETVATSSLMPSTNALAADTSGMDFLL